MTIVPRAVQGLGVEQAMDQEVTLSVRPTILGWTIAAWAAALAPGLCAAQGAVALALSRQQAVDSALAHNPGLVVLREQVSQARARKVQATAFPDPFLAADYSGAINPFNPGSRTGGDVAVGVNVPFPYKFHLNGAVGQADVDAAEFNYIQLQQQTAAETIQAYDLLLVALQQHENLLEGRSLAESFLAKTKARFDAGTVPKVDVLKAQVDLSAADNALIANARELANSRSRLDRQLGRALGALIEPTDTLAVPAALPPLDTLLAQARVLRPELKGLSRQQAGASAATTLAREFWFPDLAIVIGKNYTNGEPASYTTNLGFSVPLFFWNHTSGEVAESQHHERELAAAYLDLVAQVDLEVRQAYADAATAADQSVYLRDQLVPEARRVYEITVNSYGIGGSSALDVLDARRTYLDALRQYADVLGATNDARARLEQAVGGPVLPGDSDEH